jgi:hypothetical protein
MQSAMSAAKTSGAKNDASALFFALLASGR